MDNPGSGHHSRSPLVIENMKESQLHSTELLLQYFFIINELIAYSNVSTKKPTFLLGTGTSPLKMSYCLLDALDETGLVACDVIMPARVQRRSRFYSKMFFENLFTFIKQGFLTNLK